jgi:hypothetical protein
MAARARSSSCAFSLLPARAMRYARFRVRLRHELVARGHAASPRSRAPADRNRSARGLPSDLDLHAPARRAARQVRGCVRLRSPDRGQPSANSSASGAPVDSARPRRDRWPAGFSKSRSNQRMRALRAREEPASQFARSPRGAQLDHARVDPARRDRGGQIAAWYRSRLAFVGVVSEGSLRIRQRAGPVRGASRGGGAAGAAAQPASAPHEAESGVRSAATSVCVRTWAAAALDRGVYAASPRRAGSR